MVNKLIIDGKKAFNLSQESQRDASFRAYELITIMQTLNDRDIEALLGKMQYRQDSIISAMEAVNRVSWWRLLWLKVQRKKIVESTYA